jgi:hypothetical protein
MCNLGQQVDQYHSDVKTISKYGPRVGYRFFDLKASGFPAPVSYRTRKTWHKKIAKSDRAPTSMNDNGLYIYHSRAEAIADGGYPEGDFVLCKVKFWGKIVKHERGFRAQFAEIQSLMYRNDAYIDADVASLKKFQKHFKIKPTKFRK